MPVSENILYEKQGAIAVVTVNRPHAMNALNNASLIELETVIRDAGADPGVRGVIVTGVGHEAFIAGVDLEELKGLTSFAATTLTRQGQAVMDLIESLGKPVVAAVNGVALGAGCELAMACTIRLASQSASFGLPEVKLGILPGFGGTQRLPRLVGKGMALQLILTTDTVDAGEALRIGLVNEVMESDRLLDRARLMLQKISVNAPVAVRLALDAVNRGSETGFRPGLALERSNFALCAATADQHEAVAAHLARRAPAFRGR